MKAIIQSRYGTPDVLEFASTAPPEVGEKEVLVQVKAASVGPWVWHMIAPDPKIMRLLTGGLTKPRRRIPGEDFAGVVDQVGSGVINFAAGDEVYGFASGSFAEFAVCKPKQLAAKPRNLSFEEAAAVPIAATTALIGLRNKGKVVPGQRVLIIGAAGGVGSFAVQIGKVLGAHVTGVCSTEGVELVRSLGADCVIDYTREDFMTMGDRYDVVLQLAGTQSAMALRQVVTRRGIVVLTSGEGGHWVGPIPRLLAALVVSPFVSQTLTAFFAMPKQRDLVYLGALIEAGEITPVIERSYPVSDTAEAIRQAEAGHARGKTVVVI